MSWLDRLFGNRASKETLKERLQLVLAYDRAGMNPAKVEALRDELLAVIRKHFPAGDGAPQPKLDVEQRGDTVVLTANIPLH